MDSDDETFIFPIQEETAPAPKKLRRLRKVSSPVADAVPAASPPPKTARIDDLLKAGGHSEGEAAVAVTVPSPSLGSDVPDTTEMAAVDGIDPLLEVPDAGEMAADDGIDPLFDGPDQYAGGDASNFPWGIDEENWSRDVDGGEPQKKKSAKKRLNLDSDEGEHEEDKTIKKKKKKVRADKPDKDDEKRASNKRALEKERKARLEQLHAESQRLLRETRNASFNPVPVVQKPISAVLEKIRLRKLQVSGRSGNYSGVDSQSHGNIPEKQNTDTSDDTNDACSSRDRSKTSEDQKSAKDNAPIRNQIAEDTACLEENAVHDMPHPELRNSCASEDMGSQSEDEDISIGLLESQGQEERTVTQQHSSPKKHGFSLLATNSNSGSEFPDDISSDEQDYDKENTDPLKNKSVHLNLFKDNLAKTFLDDEAEEEDDSDHDLMRFPEDEEDDENEEQEELNDLIATAFEENHADREKLDELHQKWLEQKDARETENFMRRLDKYKRKDCSAQDEEHDEEVQEESENDIVEGDTVHENSVRDIVREAKQKISQMFTEKDDAFESSDDEESEQRISHQCLLEQIQGRASILPPVEDSDSCQVFNRIKKVNVAPDPKKRIKPTSSFDLSALRGGGNSSSKSFLGRVSTNSMPAFSKPASSCFKSFVFGRDDSNSRSGFSSSDTLDINQAQSQGSSNTRVKVNSKNGINKINNPADKTNGPSLFEILRKSSLQFDQQHKSTNERSGKSFSETQTSYRLQAFRLNNVNKKLRQEL